MEPSPPSFGAFRCVLHAAGPAAVPYSFIVPVGLRWHIHSVSFFYTTTPALLTRYINCYLMAVNFPHYFQETVFGQSQSKTFLYNFAAGNISDVRNTIWPGTTALITGELSTHLYAVNAFPFRLDAGNRVFGDTVSNVELVYDSYLTP